VSEFEEQYERGPRGPMAKKTTGFGPKGKISRPNGSLFDEPVPEEELEPIPPMPEIPPPPLPPMPEIPLAPSPPVPELEMEDVAEEVIDSLVPFDISPREPEVDDECHDGDWDHPFHFTRTSGTEGSVGEGLVYFGNMDEGDATIIEVAATTISEWFYVKIDWTSTLEVTSGWASALPEVSDTVAIYPVLHFSDPSDAETCEELISIDIHHSISDEENDHSWHFASTATTTGTISDALFYFQGVKQTVAESSTAITGSGPWTITISASHTHFYLEVDTSSTPTFTLKSGTSFPDAGSETRIYPILEFTDDEDTGSCIEHQTSDIHIDIPPPTADGHGALVTNDGVISWVYADADLQLLQRIADDSIDFDYPRYNSEDP